jgi:hypothetical protein
MQTPKTNSIKIHSVVSKINHVGANRHDLNIKRSFYTSWVQKCTLRVM